MRALQRRGALGVRFEWFADGPGARVTAVTPNSSAHHGGVLVGDVLLAADQRTFTSEAVFRSWAASLRYGDDVTLWVERGERALRPIPVKVHIYERAREVAEGVKNHYESVALPDDTLLRVIVTSPSEREPDAHVVLLPGYRRDSWDWPSAPEYPLRRWIEDVARAGFSVVRVERRGLGDSEGDGAGQGFVEERDDIITAASNALKFATRPRVIYGYSLGGLHAPFVADALSARAVAVWGSGVDTWTEYLDALLRRRMLMQRASEAQIERAVRAQQALYATVHVRGETVAQAVARFASLAEHRAMFGIDVENNAIDGRPARFWREVYQCPTAAALEGLNRPLLALWGECDWLTTRDEHQRIASISPGATMITVPRTDHGYARHDSPLASLTSPPGPYSPDAARAFVAWAREALR
jgi:pimeloyl-ACP methyl ester carboxylesterase